MTQYRTFSIPLKPDSFVPRYKFEDVGLNKEDFHSFKYIDVYGAYAPPADEVPAHAKLHIDKAFYTQYIPADDNIEYTYRLEITSIAYIPSDTILKLVSLPDVEEIDTTLFHLSHILKRVLFSDAPTDTILSAIRSV